MADTHAKNHDYHILDPSPWPLIGSIGALIMAIGAIGWMQAGQGNEFSLLGIPMANPWTFLIGTLIVLYTMFGWWSDTVRESLQGHHTKVVSLHLRYGMIMFIASEVMFFVAWFWAVFDASLFFNEAQQVGRMEYTGGQWPPAGMEVLDPLHLPLYNTVILLLSGTTVTWAHHALLHNDRQGLKMGLWLTILLAILFTCVQVYEFVIAPYSFSESLYGATFFMATGFHGFHVFVGTIFLIVCLVRAYAGQFTPEKHFGFEAAAWYWHFVDVVWLFLFFVVYIWGTWGAPIYHH
ncbi:MAG: cytochrome c oxidase subunit 3 [Roseitalea sp.]|jgi:cytochrome c oxidase subunit 3|uniref:Cytochrome c oxidase subunit 3 n=1 Tax=Oceaniradius stylonematis TaxID=2184161 RepID=A0A3A8AGM5_9HYPH|nr:cytochrome c oxidase subunit 3 [Oceaniradius stylonematis]MBO6554123.1 cytochrome c oxidase subunit 3 [Roseitalea sp.]MBO6953167.1 cytochrome c oxidase subunit 3 [Rhizobiaceae bacterium]RNC91140.1 MAG: cytochrome c oxidase subunit 3 [Oricola sp.]MBO6593514.1 cytochrome c oxidase subunit 3 [Roseitalea sp.]MBO6600910.1 cytochrome c oxidase subunit 3 [Roseitalea sp.]